MCSISINYGAGQHQNNLTEHDITEAVKWQWFLFQTYTVAITAARLAIIAFLLQIEANIPFSRKWLLYVVATINIGYNIAISVLQYIFTTAKMQIELR